MADVVLIPGLGADERQFTPQRAAMPDIRVAAWVPAKSNETLREYAVRLGEFAGVTGDSIVGGSSFGGMLALEIGRAFRCRGVILIGSARSYGAIAPFIRAVARVGRQLPPPALRLVMPLAPLGLVVIDPIRGKERALVAEMAGRAEVHSLLQRADALAAWPGCEEPGVPVVHIHGGADRVIPAGSVRADKVLAGHGHFPNLTAPEQVNRFIAMSIERFG